MDQEFRFPDSAQRYGVMHNFYFEIAISSFEKIKDSYESLEQYKSKLDNTETNSEEYYELHGKKSSSENEFYELCIKTIVFCSMCLEAAIYDYSASYLGDNYVGKHLDKLDLFSKWRLIPRLITGRDTRVGTPPYERLNSLIGTRNSLIHAKSKRITSIEDLAKIDRNEIDANIFRDSIVAIEAVVLLSLEMDENYGDLTICSLPSFRKEYIWHRDYQQHTVSLITKCRRLIKPRLSS